jgi:hypothetical protein
MSSLAHPFKMCGLDAAVHRYCAPLTSYTVRLQLDVPSVWEAEWISVPEHNLESGLTHAARVPLRTSGFEGHLTLWCAMDRHAPDWVSGLAVLLAWELEAQVSRAALQTSHDQLNALLQATPLALYSGWRVPP